MPPQKPIRRARKQRHFLRNFLVFLGGFAIIFFFLSLIKFYPHYKWAMTFDLEKLEKMTEEKVVYEENDIQVKVLLGRNRNIIPFEEIPVLMRKALVATEDQRFYVHWGFDPVGIFRAALQNLTQRRILSGASTITQQLARNSANINAVTWERKLKEILLAMRIEYNFSKDKILGIYLNRVYFGRNLYGIVEASEFYFKKRPQDLKLSECALLAGILSGPNIFDPWGHYDGAFRARNRVLTRMLNQGYISEKEVEECRKSPLLPTF